MPEQALRRHHDQRPLRRAEGLPPEQVEVLGGGGRVGHPHVVLGAELQEPLEAGRGMLGSLPLVPVGEEEGQARELPPLRAPDARNWSMMGWATFTKSPNWASHST
jgi:hypothetical protein